MTKNRSFRALYWLCLCLFFTMASACKVLTPVASNRDTDHHSWTIEAKMKCGIDTENWAFNDQVFTVRPVYIKNGFVINDRCEVIAVVYQTTSYQTAQQLRERLLGTGLVEKVSITN